MHKIYLCQSFMHSWEPTEFLGIQILTIKLFLVISIVFVFLGTPCRREVIFMHHEVVFKTLSITLILVTFV
jgi:hypothetical protein